MDAPGGGRLLQALRRELEEAQAEVRLARERVRQAEERRAIAEQSAREAWKVARWFSPGPTRRGDG